MSTLSSVLVDLELEGQIKRQAGGLLSLARAVFNHAQQLILPTRRQNSPEHEVNPQRKA